MKKFMFYSCRNEINLRKIIRVMKLTSVLILLTVFQLHASSVYSQSKRLTLKATDSSIENVLKKIENQSEFSFLYNNEQIDVEQKVNIDISDKQVEEVLKVIFKETDINYLIKDRQIVLFKGDFNTFINTLEDVRNTAKSKAQQQERNVAGKVTDSSGFPLPGVTVIVKGTTKGTTTNIQGEYLLEDIPNNATLIFSFIGMRKKEIIVAQKKLIDVVMQAETIGLEEVVAIGYGSVKKSDLTGSVASIKKEDFNQGAISSIDQAMQGRIAGVQVSQTTAEPGGGLSIRVRGASSVNAGNDPLYVIDGFPIDNGSMMSSTSSGSKVAGVSKNSNTKNPLNSLNPNDIESIEILKDASATAIYGSRGANGVVLITTKRGSDGIKFNYDGYGGVQLRSKKIDVLNTSEYIEAINTLSTESGDGTVFSDDDIAEIGDGTDWQDEIYEMAAIQSHNISMSGGVQKTKFYVSLNYFDQKGVVKETGVKRYIARINLNQEVGEKLKFGLKINTSRENSDNYIGGTSTNESAGPVYASLLYDPTESVYDEDGNFTESSELTINNPMSLIKGISSTSETNRTMGNMTLDYQIIKGLNAKVNLGVDNQNGRRDIYNSTLTTTGAASGGIANITSKDRSNFLVEYTMNYSKKFNKNHKFNALAGVTYQNFVTKTYSAGTSDFPSDEVGTNNLELGDPTLAEISSSKKENTLLSYLGRVNYSFYNFLFTSSIRADGSSRFGENNKFGYFPSFALGWKISDENFIPDYFSQLKLRASWGQTGNQDISNYQSLSTYTDGGTAILGGEVYVGTKPSRIANPDLKWETTSQLNLGLDFGFLNGRISGTIDYFHKKTTDMLLSLPLPSSSGFSSVLKNLGSMKNYGVEFMLNSRNIVNKNFSWTSTFNISSVKNEVISLDEASIIYDGDIPSIGTTTIITPGHPLNSYYGYRITGIFQDETQIANSVQPDAEPGHPIIDNVDGDDAITTSDQVILGDPFPDFTFGLRNSLTYKNFNLDFFIQGQYGADLLNANAIESMYPTNFRRNRIAEQYFDRWTTTNTDARWPSGINTSSYEGGEVNNLVIEDASYIRLKSLQLSYDLPVRIEGISSAKIYVLGQNLITLTNYSGYDPEANALGNSSAKVDFNAYPLARTWLLGINVQF
jgi:TonB-linked SusC/RagA family outer membrane protein